MTEKRIPAEVFCLAELLSDEIIARGWTTDDVAARMGGSVEDCARNLLAINLIMCVHDDKLLIGDRLFADLTEVFGVDPMFFRNIDAAWRENPKQRRPFTAPEEIFGPASRRALIRAVE